MSNYNWPMSFGELCIAEAQRQIEYAVIENPLAFEKWDKTSHLDGYEAEYYYNRPVPMPAHVKWIVSIHRHDRLVGNSIMLHVKVSDIMALRLAMYRRNR